MSTVAEAENKACVGITEKCTRDTRYEKTIGGKVHSCYDCKQALCKDGGKGGLAGTQTKSYCEVKATTFQPLSRDDQFTGRSDKLAPGTRSKKPTHRFQQGRPALDSDAQESAEIIAPNNRFQGTDGRSQTRKSTTVKEQRKKD